MLKNLLLVLLGLILGWATVPLVISSGDYNVQTSDHRAYVADDFLDGNSYRAILRRMEEIMKKMEVTSRETAENTKAIKEKLGAN